MLLIKVLLVKCLFLDTWIFTKLLHFGIQQVCVHIQGNLYEHLENPNMFLSQVSVFHFLRTLKKNRGGSFAIILSLHLSCTEIFISLLSMVAIFISTFPSYQVRKIARLSFRMHTKSIINIPVLLTFWSKVEGIEARPGRYVYPQPWTKT